MLRPGGSGVWVEPAAGSRDGRFRHRRRQLLLMTAGSATHDA